MQTPFGSRAPVTRLTRAWCLCLAAWGGPLELAAQQPEPAGARPPPPPVVAQEEVSPGGAFLRSLLVPGWGHAAIGEHTRGGFYFLAESVSGWMIVRTVSRLNAAKAVRDLRLSEVTARLADAGVTEPRAVAAAQDADPLVRGARELVDARGQHFQDWLALGIFLAFMSGADAFVSAHLKDFPDPVRPELRPGALGPELRFSRPVGGAGGR